MNTATIPAPVLTKARAWLRKWGKAHFGTVETLPSAAPEGVTTGTGTFKAGLRVWIISGEERTVFLGPDAALRETVIPEFTLLTESGEQRVCQYGRDFRFAA